MVMSEKMRAAGWIEHDGRSVPECACGVIPVMLFEGRQTFDRFGFWLWADLDPMGLEIVAYMPGATSSQKLAA